MKKNIISYLYDRNLIKKIIKENELKKFLCNENIKIFCGFDPTSDSLHIGHLIILICIKNFIEFDHEASIIIGGSTGLIGDPSFRNSRRNLYTKNFIENNSEKIKKQIENIFHLNIKRIKLLNNNEWLKSIKLIDFLYEIGVNFSINKILSNKSIKERILSKKNKISFTEISYLLLQSYDFLYLYKRYNIKLQLGGSDQLNNIIFGINLINKIYKDDVYGLTVPIITKSNGCKFGKTYNDTIWLDKNKTSVYKFYQFWINISDENVFSFLKMFTNESLDSINNMEKKKNSKSIIHAKKILADKITFMVHGKDELNSAIRITNSLFNENMYLKEDDIKQLYKDGINTAFLKIGINLKQALVESKIALSNNESKKMILSNSIKINGIKNSNLNYIFSKKDLFYNKYTFICKGKKNHCLIVWI